MHQRYLLTWCWLAHNPVSCALTLNLYKTLTNSWHHHIMPLPNNTPSTQYLQQKHIHDSNRPSESFQVGNRIWPVVNQGHIRKFVSFWKGLYTVTDKLGEVTYKIQLIGGIQMLVVHRNWLKPCLTPPQLPVDTVTAQDFWTHLLCWCSSRPSYVTSRGIHQCRTRPPHLINKGS